MSFKLADALVYLGAKRDGLGRDLNDAERQTRSWAKSVGDGLAIAIGDRLLTAVQTGIRAVADAGKAVWDYSLDSQRAVGNLQAQLGITRTEAELLGKVAQNVWKNNFGSNVVEAADAVGQVRAQLSQLTAEQLQQVTQTGFAIRDTYGEQMPKYISAVRSLMETMGLSHQEAMDFIAAGYQRGLNRSDDFLDSINEYAPQFSSMEMAAGSFFSILETGLQGGVLGTDKAADMLKEFRVRLLDGSETTREGLRLLGMDVDAITGQINDGTLSWADAFTAVQDGIRSTDDQAVQMQAGVAILGTQFEDLGTQAVLGIDMANTAMGDLAGAADTVGARYSNIQDIFSGMGRRLIAALSPASTFILELANDNLPQLEAVFGRIEANLSALSGGIIGIVMGIAATFRAFFGGLRRDTDTELGGTAQKAGSWGVNISVQLARGIAAGAVAVVRALQQIAAVVTHWLRPHSPPALLPDIDKWGTGTMQAWLDGFGAADVGVLKGMTGRIQEVLSGLANSASVRLVDTISQAVAGLLQSGGKDDEGLVGRLLGSRQAIATAVALIEKTGDVGGATFGLIEQALRPLPAAARDYTRAMLEMHLANQQVANAQDKLNAVTQAYSDRLRPLRKELADLQRQQEDAADGERIAELQSAIARGALTDEEKVLAARELKELQLRRQIRGIEAEEDAAVSAAQAELDKASAQQKAAAEAAAMQEALMAAQQTNNDLLSQQVSLLQQLAGAMAGIGGALGDLAGGAGLGDAFAITPPELGDDPLGLGDDPLGLDDLADGLDLQSIIDDVLAEFAPLEEEMGSLSESVNTLGTAWDGWLQRMGLVNEEGQISTGVLGTLGDIVTTVGAAFVGAKIAAFLGGIFAALSSGTGIVGAIGTAVAALGGPFAVLIALVAALFAAWQTDFMGMQTTLKGLWGLVQEIFRLISEWMEEKITEAGASIEETLLAVREWFTTTLPNAWEQAKTALGEKLDAMKTAVKNWQEGVAEKLEAMKTKFNEIKDKVLAPFKKAWDEIGDAINWVKDVIALVKGGLDGLEIPDWLQRHSPPPLAQSLADVAAEMANLSRQQIPAFRHQLTGMDSDGAPFPVGAPTGAAAASQPTTAVPNQVIFEAGAIAINDASAAQLFIEYLRGQADDLSFGGLEGGLAWR